MKLEARDLSYRYPPSGQRVHSHLSLTLDEGEILGLSAPSGTGKTTLCKLLAGYEPLQQGSVTLDGQPLPPPRGRPCPVQLIWQHPEQAVNPRFRVRDILREGGQVPPEWLEGLQIQPEWLTRFPLELSGGELQRVCIARALAARPRFLLCDEITAMLDLITQSQIWHFLLDQQRQSGFGVLVVSHSPSLLQALCARPATLPETVWGGEEP